MQRILETSLVKEGDADAFLREAMAGVDGQRLPQLGDRRVEHPEVQVNHPQVVMRLGEVWVQGQGASIFLDRELVGESTTGPPQQEGSGIMTLGEIGVEPERLLGG